MARSIITLFGLIDIRMVQILQPIDTEPLMKTIAYIDILIDFVLAPIGPGHKRRPPVISLRVVEAATVIVRVLHRVVDAVVQGVLVVRARLRLEDQQLVSR